ncbi:phenylalanine--tRNA ligase subunit beta [Mycoplasma mycoides subsp. mycoides]|uniref:Phenylalanine--tRNA ligase beta subunit n=2 Tax=Mycoplasma mycoides subsp. mycoides TaxID=2103 RepID=SYFB_MYCMS|nr:phenylalanine--tRNA ligase subunit beta [Mycoplasma mycoides]Q6MT18.1 RecName: Full=Phenylalanine--tRNA ligase beta subunit; AltName: Full=Phenylalanyl-tRNA synthetase beta subunit; Short=PheRS [Mycoplasma mycoides subsp. mycoides SC str. PG1]ADK69796.1 phenylalanine--tRNA ligase, beta subunit [Mycoplasma mycoides subsp. mycoides SC str. Gladysdale]AIZ55452.1 tRNA-binding domain-containing protein [Mycoplasma mycoides subsp. mycoides]AME10802.1 phenylalanyl-tRNA synthetase subunit beta [Myco
MIITRNWLKKYLNLDNISNDQINMALNSLGFEVDSVYDLNSLNSELILGYVEQSKQIPDTHLKLNQVNIGTKSLQIVCGASNVDANQFVVIAPINATIANGLTLTSKKIQNYESQGMICALNEIGIDLSVINKEDQLKIYNVSDKNLDLKKYIGSDVKQIIGLDDYLFEIDLTLNRSDCLASFQILKELANYFDLKIKNLDNNFSDFKKNNLDLKIDLANQVKDQIKTISYSYFELNNKNDKLDSKDEIFLKLNQINSSNHSITNLSLISTLSTAQTHILIDLDKLKSSNLKLEFINHDNKELLCLTNNNKLVNIIGLDTQNEFNVDNNSKNVLNIMLNIEPNLMRKQQKLLNISNTYLQRYIKPINPNLFNLANQTFSNLLNDYQLINKAYEVKILKQTFKNKQSLEIKLNEINDLLGTNLTIKQIKSLFKHLDFKITNKDDLLDFQIDQNRIDITSKNDLCEEVARLYSYDKIDEIPLSFTSFKKAKNLNLKLENKLTNYLIGLGFNNTKTYSLTSLNEAKYWNLFNISEFINLVSPLSNLRQTYRTNLSKSLIDVAIFNHSINNKELKLFEIADIYDLNNLKQRHLVFLTSNHIYKNSLNQQLIENNFYYNKEILENIFNLYNLDLSEIQYQSDLNLIKEIHPYINTTIYYQNQLIGYLYKLNPKFESENKLNPTFVCEINLDILNQFKNSFIEAKTLSKFQSSSRDLTIEISNDLTYQKVLFNALSDVKYLKSHKIVDLYLDDNLIKNNTKALTIQFVFNDLEHQLTENEINQEFEKIIKNIKQMKVVIR